MSLYKRRKVSSYSERGESGETLEEFLELF